MTMLRKEWEADANDVIVKAMEQADLFAAAAAHLAVSHAPAAALCRHLSAKRRKLGRDLTAALRAEGIFPRIADPEHEAADGLLANVKSALSRDEAESLLKSRLDADQALRNSVRRALHDGGLPGDIEALLTDFSGALADDDARLHAWLQARAGSGDA